MTDAYDIGRFAEHVPWEGPTPLGWEQVLWPAWVPISVREEIVGFWSDFGRGPRNYQQQHATNYAHAPPLGWRGFHDRGRYGIEGPGRYVHCWNNIGRLILDDGSIAYASTGGLRPEHPEVACWGALCGLEMSP
jgi:hypothetical protein